MSILLIPNFKTPNLAQTHLVDPSDWWDELETNLWEDWDKITERKVTSWQYCINKCFFDEDRTSTHWLYVFLVNSCNAELNKEIEKKFDKLHKNRKGGVTYLFYLLTSTFKMTCEIKKAIQHYLGFWRDKGLSKIQGENVAQAELLLLGCCKRLDAAGALGDKYVLDILEGLCICFCAEFKNMFEPMLNMAKLGNFNVLSTIKCNSTPLEMIEAILTKEVDHYDLIARLGHCNVPNNCQGGGGGNNGGHDALKIAPKRKCWNYGKEGYSVEKCKQPKNAEHIKQNKKKYFDQKKASQGNENYKNEQGNNNGGGGGYKGFVDKSSPAYQGKKWGERRTRHGWQHVEMQVPDLWTKLHPCRKQARCLEDWYLHNSSSPSSFHL